MARYLFNHKIWLWHEMDAEDGKNVTSVRLPMLIPEILSWFIVQFGFCVLSDWLKSFVFFFRVLDTENHILLFYAL